MVLLYDPVATATGTLSLRAFRLSDRFHAVRAKGLNEFLPPREVLEELPVRIRNPGLVNALLFDVRGAKALACDFERLDLSTNPCVQPSNHRAHEPLASSHKLWAAAARGGDQWWLRTLPLSTTRPAPATTPAITTSADTASPALARLFLASFLTFLTLEKPFFWAVRAAP